MQTSVSDVVQWLVTTRSNNVDCDIKQICLPVIKITHLKWWWTFINADLISKNCRACNFNKKCGHSVTISNYNNDDNIDIFVDGFLAADTNYDSGNIPSPRWRPSKWTVVSREISRQLYVLRSVNYTNCIYIHSRLDKNGFLMDDRVWMSVMEVITCAKIYVIVWSNFVFCVLGGVCIAWHHSANMNRCHFVTEGQYVWLQRVIISSMCSVVLTQYDCSDKSVIWLYILTLHVIYWFAIIKQIAIFSNNQSELWSG